MSATTLVVCGIGLVVWTVRCLSARRDMLAADEAYRGILALLAEQVERAGTQTVTDNPDI